jgi:uncharacterized protein with ParB-like and HNH nuclease domain
LPGLAQIEKLRAFHGAGLDYRSQKINIQNGKLMEFIRQLSAGEFLIPTFQRLFVWSPENISGLWDSIFRCYPIGSILYWQTSLRLHVHRNVGGFYIPENGLPGSPAHSYILDGQQRATSLMISFWGGTGKIRERSSFDYTLYFDLRNSSFFFENEYYRHRWETKPEFLVRLKDVPDLPADYGSRLAMVQGYLPAVDRNLQQLRYTFTEYRLPLICLEGFDLAGVCAIYERVNQTGMRLTNTDILIARGFKNYSTVVEEDFPTIAE